MSKQVDFRAFTLEDVVEILNDTGYITTMREFAYANDNNLFKYIGCKNGCARYLVAMENEEKEGEFFVTIIFVTIGSDGKLVADYAGMPAFESSDEDKIAHYVTTRCN